MKRVGIIAHFGFGFNLLNGQTIKAQILCEAMESYVGVDQIETVDTHGGAKRVLGLIFDTVMLFYKCQNIIILPGDKGLRLLLPLTALCNRIFHKKLFHVVIGGWLPEFLEERKYLSDIEKTYDRIYVETEAMKNTMEEHEFNNVSVLPNCKVLKKMRFDEIVYETNEPYHLCTFSRVMREKGIEEAIEAVKCVNKLLGRTAFSLDIYGQVWKTYKERFAVLQKELPDFIHYKGNVQFDKSVETLARYTALLFPTYYKGEGVAGTLIDSLAAGVPVIASNWKYNGEVITSGKTGVLIDNCSAEEIVRQLIKIVDRPDEWNAMKKNCLVEAKKYNAYDVYEELLKDMEK